MSIFKRENERQQSSMNNPLMYLLLAFFSAGCALKGKDVCDWTDYLNSINKQQGYKSIHPSENGFKPILTKSSTSTGLKMMLQDFRQFEFISTSYLQIILNELDSVKKIKKEHTIIDKPDIGLFNKVYIRNKIKSPIEVELTVSQLKEIFTKDFIVDSLIITNCDLKIVEHGFSFYLDGIPFYGVTDSTGKIILLGILTVEPQHDTKENHDKIKELMVRKSLVLVAWNSESVLEPKDFEEQ